MNHTTKTVRLAIIVIAATLMISGTIFYPMVRKEQLAYSLTSSAHEEERKNQQQEQQQHMDQGNLCLRTGDCNNSNVGEQTLGNDNSVTGFSDQSKNVQATVEPTVTPTVTPTPTPTVTPTPTPTVTPVPGTCPQANLAVWDLSLTADLKDPVTGDTVLPEGAVICVTGGAFVLGEIVNGVPMHIALLLDGAPTPPAPGTCPANNVVAVVASGTVPPSLNIGPLGVCVHVGTAG